MRKLDSPRKLVSYKELKSVYGITFSRRHLARLESEKKFPTRVALGEHRVGWVMSEIEDWLAQKLANRKL